MVPSKSLRECKRHSSDAGALDVMMALGSGQVPAVSQAPGLTKRGRLSSRLAGFSLPKAGEGRTLRNRSAGSSRERKELPGPRDRIY